MSPFPASSIAGQFADTLGDSELVRASISNGRTPSQLPTAGAPQVLDIPTSPLVGADFLEVFFTGKHNTPIAIGITLILIQ